MMVDMIDDMIQEPMPSHRVGPQPREECKLVPATMGYAVYSRPITTESKLMT